MYVTANEARHSRAINSHGVYLDCSGIVEEMRAKNPNTGLLPAFMSVIIDPAHSEIRFQWLDRDCVPIPATQLPIYTLLAQDLKSATPHGEDPESYFERHTTFGLCQVQMCLRNPDTDKLTGTTFLYDCLLFLRVASGSLSQRAASELPTHAQF
jgi:hypothetical protein